MFKRDDAVILDGRVFLQSKDLVSLLNFSRFLIDFVKILHCPLG